MLVLLRDYMWVVRRGPILCLCCTPKNKVISNYHLISLLSEVLLKFNEENHGHEKGFYGSKMTSTLEINRSMSLYIFSNRIQDVKFTPPTSCQAVLDRDMYIYIQSRNKW